MMEEKSILIVDLITLLATLTDVMGKLYENKKRFNESKKLRKVKP